MKLTQTFATVALALALAGAASAGVTATKKSGKLVVVGSGAAVVIRVEGAGALGEVAVFQGTTPQMIGFFAGVRDVEIKTGAGEDKVVVSALEIGGSLKVRTGADNDRFELDVFRVGGSGTGRVSIGGSVDVQLGGQPAANGLGPDTVEWTAAQTFGIVIGKDLRIRGAGRVAIDGSGPTSDSDAGDIQVGGSLSIESAVQTFVALFDMNVGGATKIELGGAKDTVELRRSHFTRSFRATLGGGDDAIDLKFPSEFNAAVTLDGGKGANTLAGIEDEVLAIAPVAKNFGP